ncbi:MAG: hypothetical protein AAF657_18470 [Acidobacteriota bacterium]
MSNPGPQRQPTSRLRRDELERTLRSVERCIARGRFDGRAYRSLESFAEQASDLSILNRIGDLLARSDRLGPGIAVFERVARAYADDGFWAKAIAIYQKILRYDPRRTDVRARLAFLYQHSGLPTRA